MNKPIPATEDDPALLRRLAAIPGWLPEWLNVARFVAYTFPEYAWAQQYLRNFTPEEREEVRAEGKRILAALGDAA